MIQKGQQEAIWAPDKDRMQSSQMAAFARFAASACGREFADYSALQAWSCSDIDRFWSLAAEFLGIRWRVPAAIAYRPPVAGGMLGAQWFPGSRLSWTENLLAGPEDPKPKIISIIEGRREPIIYTGAALYQAVSQLAQSLQSHGVGPGDRVGAVLPNSAEAVIGMLATAALGAIWSSCSPDFGTAGIVDRFSQIEPKVLIATRSYMYNTKVFDCRSTAQAVLRELPSVVLSVMVDPLEEGVSEGPWIEWRKLLQSAQVAADWQAVATPFDAPLYILYSSGTTGKPKCIVHSVGGTLLQHKKELMLHSNLGPGKRLLYFTTCGWMMWNWMASALSVDSCLVLFEGSVLREDSGILWRTVAEQGVHAFGTSPRFLAACQQAGVEPRRDFDLSRLETLLSTGSPLLPEQYDWVYNHVKAEVHLASISGGTDIVSCFMLGNPLSPVHRGEIQGPGLGMALECWDENGHSVRETKGELVCTQPFPAMPLGFWQDDGQKYRETYFRAFPQREVWRHGDFIEMTASGGIIVYGRSDATLNPGGVRIGTAEIYRQVESFAEVQDSLAIAHRGDAEVLLFVQLRPGFIFDASLQKRICQKIRQELSPRHVPTGLFEVAAIPYTRSGKKLELAVTRIFQGLPLDNQTAIANPESLEDYRRLAQTRGKSEV